ncbi:unnamed protein product [Brassica oleracea]
MERNYSELSLFTFGFNHSFLSKSRVGSHPNLPGNSPAKSHQRSNVTQRGRSDASSTALKV